MAKVGGKRPGAGRKPGSKATLTIQRQSLRGLLNETFSDAEVKAKFKELWNTDPELVLAYKYGKPQAFTDLTTDGEKINFETTINNFKGMPDDKLQSYLREKSHE